MNNFIKFSTDITAANVSKRTLQGVIVPFNEVGHTSMGDVVFTANSLSIPEGVKLYVEHDLTRPIGKLTSYDETETGIIGTFKIAKTNAGDDALAEASEGLRTGFSVGALISDYDLDEERVMVKSSTLKEVSHVGFPAFGNFAQITEVAASAETSQPTESENTNVSNEVTPEVKEEVATEVAAPVVEAAERKIMPAIFTAPRSPIISGGSYLEHTIKAAMGNEDSRQYVKAADDSFTTNPAFNPTAFVRDVVTTTTSVRPAIEACGGTRALPPAGMTISIPKITANATSATVAEGGDPTGTTAITSAYVNATVIKKAGFQRYSAELLDRSDPAFYEIMLQNLRDAHAVATDSYVVAQLTAGGTAASAQDADSDGIIGFVSTEAAAAYSATKKVARNYVAGVGQWSLLMGATDGSGRPIYNASQPQNSGGNASPTSIRGNVLGLDFYVDPNMVSTVIDESAFIIEPGSIEIYESPALTLQTNVPTTGELEIMLYGYIAAQVTVSGGIRRFNLT